MSGQGPCAAPAPAGGVVAEDAVPDEPLVPVDGVVEEPEPEPESEVDAAADEVAGAVVVDVEVGVVAAPDANVPTPTPRPAVPAVTASATTSFLNRECMSHLPCRVRGNSPRHP
jgi:hypothetical protein